MLALAETNTTIQTEATGGEVMNDRELLELAAKAAGLKFSDYPFACEEGLYLVGPEGPGTWNPLADDGDALRLAVKWKLKVEHHYYEGEYYCRVFWDALAPPVIEHHAKDQYAATRRAIVRAAAEIGKGLK